MKLVILISLGTFIVGYGLASYFDQKNMEWAMEVSMWISMFVPFLMIVTYVIFRSITEDKDGNKIDLNNEDTEGPKSKMDNMFDDINGILDPIFDSVVKTIGLGITALGSLLVYMLNLAVILGGLIGIIWLVKKIWYAV